MQEKMKYKKNKVKRVNKNEMGKKLCVSECKVYHFGTEKLLSKKKLLPKLTRIQKKTK